MLTDEAEAKLAHWLGVADTFIFPSVTLANIGLLPSVAPAGDLLIVDREVLGTLDNVLMAGSLSKGFSCLGGFVTCTPELKTVLKICSSTFIFGGPVPPPYLAAICAVCDIIESPEYDVLLGTLHDRRRQLMSGLDALGLSYHAGQAAIVSLLVGDIEKTFAAGRELFDRGYYVQSATYPAVPINAGLLRIQVNVNHSPEAVDGLLEALAAVRTKFWIRPRPQALPLPEAGLS